MNLSHTGDMQHTTLDMQCWKNGFLFIFEKYQAKCLYLFLYPPFFANSNYLYMNLPIFINLNIFLFSIYFRHGNCVYWYLYNLKNVQPYTFKHNNIFIYVLEKYSYFYSFFENNYQNIFTLVQIRPSLMKSEYICICICLKVDRNIYVFVFAPKILKK